MRGCPDNRLAQRYRRWLWAYPSDFRHERGDEIIGVLLDVARPDQARPSLRDVGDLVRAGLLARAGATRVGYLSSHWRDAVAVISVLLPLVVAARVVLWARQVFFAVGSGSFHLAQWDGPDFRYGAVSAVLWLVVALAVVTGWRRAAVVCATVATTVHGALVIRLAIIDAAFAAFGLVAVLVVEVLASVLLARRPDVERGVELVGRRALAAALVGFVLVKSGRDGWAFGSLGVVGRWLCLAGGLSVLVWLMWSRRRVLMAGALGLRLGVAGVVLVGIAGVTGMVQRRTNVGHATMKHLIILFVLCLLWAAVVVIATALTGHVAGRLGKRLPASVEAHR